MRSSKPLITVKRINLQTTGSLVMQQVSSLAPCGQLGSSKSNLGFRKGEKKLVFGVVTCFDSDLFRVLALVLEDFVSWLQLCDAAASAGSW